MYLFCYKYVIKFYLFKKILNLLIYIFKVTLKKFIIKKFLIHEYILNLYYFQLHAYSPYYYSIMTWMSAAYFVE